MAFCGKCGTSMNDDVKFCPSCGAPSGGAAPAPQAATGEAQADPQDAQDNKAMAIIAYILFFIPLLTGDHQKSPFVKFHTNQGTVLCISSIAFGIAYFILSAILAFIPILGWLLILLLSLCWFLFPILGILGIINAVNGKMAPLPLIGKLFTIIK